MEILMAFDEVGRMWWEICLSAESSHDATRQEQSWCNMPHRHILALTPTDPWASGQTNRSRTA